MNPDAVIRILRESMLLVLMLSAGPLGVLMLVGLVVSLLQATTQLNEQTLSFVPKMIALFLTLAILGPWMLSEAVRFTQTLFNAIALVR